MNNNRLLSSALPGTFGMEWPASLEAAFIFKNANKLVIEGEKKLFAWMERWNTMESSPEAGRHVGGANTAKASVSPVIFPKIVYLVV